MTYLPGLLAVQPLPYIPQSCHNGCGRWSPSRRTTWIPPASVSSRSATHHVRVLFDEYCGSSQPWIARLCVYPSSVSVGVEVGITPTRSSAVSDRSLHAIHCTLRASDPLPLVYPNYMLAGSGTISNCFCLAQAEAVSRSR